jgi:putative peptidoglycan lipid II flippase
MFTSNQGPERGRHDGRSGERGHADTGRTDTGRTDTGRGNGQSRPTFTPREDYVSPSPGVQQQPSYQQPTAMFFAPPGYPQPSFTPFPYGEEPPRQRRRPGPRPDGADGRPAQDRGEYADGGTQVLDIPGELPPEVSGTGPQQAVGTQPNLMRSSKAMAIGTIASRGTGFLRTLMLVAALGSGTLANAYNVSNTLPNTVLYLMLGGIFTSVVVPLLVKAAKNHPDKGEAYSERIFTLGAISLLLVTVIGMALSDPLIDLYMPGTGGSEHRVAVLFAYFFIPQIFFYGMDSLLGAILNTKGRFGPNMWTPVINNVVVIAVFGLFIALDRGVSSTSNISSSGIDLLGLGTTLGIVIQSIALFPIVKRAGFSFRLRFNFRRDEVSEIRRMAGGMLVYVISTFAANLVLTMVADMASNHPGAGNDGYSAYTYANQLFQLPYAIVGLSVISALLPRMAGHATDRRYSLVRDDFSTGVRLASVIVVPAAVFLGVLGAPLCEVLFSYGHESVSSARYAGEVFGMLSLGLVPFMLTQLQLRVFYSFHDNRTPGIIGIVMLAVGVAGDFIALNVLPASEVVIGEGAVYGLMTLVGAAIAWPLLLRHVGSLDGWRITRSLVRMFLATIPGLVWAFLVMAVANSVLRQGTFYGLASVIIGGGGAVMLYAICARVLGIEEFRVLIRTVAGRFGR